MRVTLEGGKIVCNAMWCDDGGTCVVNFVRIAILHDDGGTCERIIVCIAMLCDDGGTCEGKIVNYKLTIVQKYLHARKWK